MAPPQLRQQASNCSLLLIYQPRKDERLSWPGWLTYSGWFTHISDHPLATGRAQARKVRQPKIDILPLCHAIHLVGSVFCVPFIALTLMVGWQERHLAHRTSRFTNPQGFCSGTGRGRQPDGKPADPMYLENGCYMEVVVPFALIAMEIACVGGSILVTIVYTTRVVKRISIIWTLFLTAMIDCIGV